MIKKRLIGAKNENQVLQYQAKKSSRIMIIVQSKYNKLYSTQWTCCQERAKKSRYDCRTMPKLPLMMWYTRSSWTLLAGRTTYMQTTDFAVDIYRSPFQFSVELKFRKLIIEWGWSVKGRCIQYPQPIYTICVDMLAYALLDSTKAPRFLSRNALL